MKRRLSAVSAWVLLAGGLVIVATNVAQSASPPQWSGYSTGTNVFADVLKNLVPGAGSELANANVAFSGAASDTAGLQPQNNEMDHAVVPPGALNSYGRGSGLEVGLGTTLPNN